MIFFKRRLIRYIFCENEENIKEIITIDVNSSGNTQSIDLQVALSGVREKISWMRCYLQEGLVFR